MLLNIEVAQPCVSTTVGFKMAVLNKSQSVCNGVGCVVCLQCLLTMSIATTWYGCYVHFWHHHFKEG